MKKQNATLYFAPDVKIILFQAEQLICGSFNTDDLVDMGVNNVYDEDF
ncbi:MAG: hypothetical protein J6Y32_00135 [Bacteroidales bacterium]|nr:hypothetical protein [Bacteroidales bacterium]